MTVQLVLLLLISNLNFIASEANISAAIIDSYPENITEWDTFSIRPCEESSTRTILLFTCELPSQYLQVIDKTCLRNKTLSFHEEICRPPRIPQPYECLDKNYIGLYCNITNDICQPSSPCENQAICRPNQTLPLKYSCQCLSDEYSGEHCENDNRVCKNNTCWHDGQCINGRVSIDNKTAFECICKPGYNGTHCEMVDNMCANITCQNEGRCITSYLSWSCRCLDLSFYSGMYCEHKSSLLVMRQILSKSFASIAIAAIIAVFIFVILMDVFKYVFKIDPVDRERRLMELEEAKKQSSKYKNKKKNEVVLRVIYKA